MNMERIYRLFYKQVKHDKRNLKTFFLNKFKDINVDLTLPKCHKLKERIMERYYSFRVRVQSRKISVEKTVTYSSKSVAMHEIVK